VTHHILAALVLTRLDSRERLVVIVIATSGPVPEHQLVERLRPDPAQVVRRAIRRLSCDGIVEATQGVLSLTTPSSWPRRRIAQADLVRLERMTLTNNKGHSATRGDDHSQMTPEPILHAAGASGARGVADDEKEPLRTTEGRSVTSGGARHSVKARVRPVDMGNSHIKKPARPSPVQADQLPDPDDFLSGLDAMEPAPILPDKPKTSGASIALEDHVGNACAACVHARDLLTSPRAGFRTWANWQLSSCKCAEVKP
jgi:hypothetical protein